MRSFLNETYFVSRQTANRNFRSNIFEAWDYECAYCGAGANTLDHIHPKSKGGLHQTQNLVACCADCNLAKGSLNMKKWYRAQTFYCFLKENKICEWRANPLRKTNNPSQT